MRRREYDARMSDALIIIPTFNERENIGLLIDALFALPVDLHVLVVDDNSPDHTAEVVRERQQYHNKSLQDDRLHLILRREGKGGRGTACMTGFAFARERAYGVAIEMDADFSHDPADIPRLLQKIADGADVAVASKYLPGSRILNWPRSRYLLSRGANIYANMILRLPISDYTNGFRGYGNRALKILPDLPVDGKGFTLIAQTTYLLSRAGMKFAEIPSVFTNRRRGRSNLGTNEIIESTFALLKLRSEPLHHHLRQLTKFALVGGSGLLLDLLLLSAFVEIADLPLKAAAPFTTMFILCYVFLLNKYWTFRNNEKKHVRQGILFLLVYLSSAVLLNAITLFLVAYLQIWYLLARIIAAATCALWNYAWLHLKVFRRSTQLV